MGRGVKDKKDEKERNKRNGTKRRDRVLLIAQRKGLGFIDLSGRGDRRAYQSITLICTVCRGSHQSHLIIHSLFVIFLLLLLFFS